jgi:hypothetical protein
MVILTETTPCRYRVTWGQQKRRVERAPSLPRGIAALELSQSGVETGQMHPAIVANAAEMLDRETGPKLLFLDSEIFRSRSSTLGAIYKKLRG